MCLQFQNSVIGQTIFQWIHLYLLVPSIISSHYKCIPSWWRKNWVWNAMRVSLLEDPYPHYVAYFVADARFSSKTQLNFAPGSWKLMLKADEKKGIKSSWGPKPEPLMRLIQRYSLKTSYWTITHEDWVHPLSSKSQLCAYHVMIFFAISKHHLYFNFLIIFLNIYFLPFSLLIFICLKILSLSGLLAITRR
jgi:hypothetical protein